MASEWTDEKHRLYLDSIEASFVKQLFNSGYSSNDRRLSRDQIHINASGSEFSDIKSQPFGQFQVLCRGCRENVKSERAYSHHENENKSNRMSINHWGRHFRSHSTAKVPQLMLAAQMGEDNLVSQSVDLINWRHGRVAAGLEQPPPFYSRKVRKVSVGSITEVSDQNFLDADVEREEELSRRRGTKRPRSAASLVTDQVVPFVPPTTEENAFLKESNGEDSKMNVESRREVLQKESRASHYSDQQPNDPKLEGG